MGFDMSQYLGIFLDEAEEQLQELDQGILNLEQNTQDHELVNRIFRAAHTLKGSSASMGFDKMASLTHAMENVLDRVRRSELKVSRSLVDILLASLDKLRALKGEIAAGEDRQVEIDGLCEQLKAVGMQQEANNPPAADQGEKPAAMELELDEVEKNVARAAEVKGYRIYHVTVTLEAGTVMKAARAYIVFNNLQDVGEVIKTVPSSEEIESEKFDDSFQLVLITREDPDTVANTIKSVSEIAGAQVVPVTPDGGVTLEAQAEADSAPGEGGAGKGSGDRKVAQTVRVDVQRLENLMNLVGELVIDRTRLAQVGLGLKNSLGGQDKVETLEEVSTHIGRITGELQEEIMKARMFPIEQVFNRFPRMVRDLAQKAGKEVDFIVEGRETELDRTVIEEIGDPLIHLLRNAVDHGIESPEEREKLGKPRQGRVRLRAFHQENQIVITVEDDGRGMDVDRIRAKAVEKGLITRDIANRLADRDAVNLIFVPGFSTAEKISDVSGRGVGMDIVRDHIERINGIIDIETVLGRGSCFTIKLPLTLAINRSLLVFLDERVFAVPLANVVEIINVQAEAVQKVQQREVVLVRGAVLPLVRMDRLLGFDRQRALPERFSVVVVGISERRVGIIVDGLVGEQEIVIKSLGEFVGQVPGLAGATIMGDGQVALILDVRGLLGKSGLERSHEFLAS